MAIKVELNDDGSLHYISDGHVVLTGPISGAVTTADGTTYNVSPALIEVESPEHAAEVAHLVATRYANEGHPTDETFTYTPTEG